MADGLDRRDIGVKTHHVVQIQDDIWILIYSLQNLIVIISGSLGVSQDTKSAYGDLKIMTGQSIGIDEH